MSWTQVTGGTSPPPLFLECHSTCLNPIKALCKLETQAGSSGYLLVLEPPKTSLTCKLPCLLKLPPTSVGWSATFFRLLLPSTCRVQFQISPGKLLRVQNCNSGQISGWCPCFLLGSSLKGLPGGALRLGRASWHMASTVGDVWQDLQLNRDYCRGCKAHRWVSPPPGPAAGQSSLTGLCVPARPQVNPEGSVRGWLVSALRPHRWWGPGLVGSGVGGSPRASRVGVVSRQGGGARRPVGSVVATPVGGRARRGRTGPLPLGSL